MKVWIEQDLCTGDGLCEDMAPSVFRLQGGVSHVCDHLGTAHAGATMVEIPPVALDLVLDAAEECPGECIFVEA